MDLKGILIAYITQQETDFAVLVDGPWGSGKTHFLKNEIGPLISKIQCSIKEEKGEVKKVPYELVYVSLFGLSSLDELQRRLFTELNPVLKNKVIKGGMMLINKGLQFFNMGAGEDDSLELMNILGGIKRNKILVFDDMERLSDDLLNEVMGFINTYTEHQGLKVIIIAHEDIISNKVQDYALVKEKLIRFTYTYAPELLTVLPNFLSRYNDQDFNAFVDTNKQILLRSFERGEHINLRSLRFFLDLFFVIFNNVKKIQGMEESSRNEMLQRFFFFLLTYCIEYKKNGIDDTKLQQLKDLSGTLEAGGLGSFIELLDNVLRDDDQQEAQPALLSFNQDFEKRYIENSGQTYRYYECIVQYVHSGNLDITDLEKECRLYNDTVAAIQVSPEFAAFHQLENCLLLEDEDFIRVYEQVLAIAFEGQYKLEMYPKLFETITNCAKNRIQGVTIDSDLIQRFKAGMDKSISGSSYTGRLTFMTYVEDEQLKDIRKYATQLNESLLESKSLEISRIALAMFKNEDFDALDPFLQTEMRQTTIFREPVFEPDLFAQRFLAMRNMQKRKCIEVIQRSYERFDHQTIDQREVQFWNRVHDILSSSSSMLPTDGSHTMSSISVGEMMLSIRRFVPLPSENS